MWPSAPPLGRGFRYTTIMAAGMNRPAGALDLATALAPYRGPWNERLAAHLLRRAGFGGTSERIAQGARRSPHDAVEALMQMPDARSMPGPDNVYDPRSDLFNIRQEFRGDPTARKAAMAGVRKQMRDSVISMQQWWLNRMLTTPAPLQERMTLYLHGHFTTAAIQKGVWPSYVWQQNQLYRSNALGNLHDLTLAVSRDPGMLLYLDNARSMKAHPNENYARELMELFTLGHGNYSEEDVRQSARAFTGWTIDGRTGRFLFNRNQHDDGRKTFLGRTGNFDGTDIVDIIYQQPAASKFWATSLLNYFVYNDPEPELVDRVAALLRKNDFALAPVMSTLLQSNVFYSDRAYRALVKSPAEFVVGTHVAFGLQQIVPNAFRAMGGLGQMLFFPPNVAGWPGGTNWITSQTLIARENFVAGLVNSPVMSNGSWVDQLPLQADVAAKQLVGAILQNDAPTQGVDQIVGYLNGAGTSALGTFNGENFQERVRGAAYLTMAMPAYQLA